jgi:tetratricopeptide (TPR) repeat protein
MYGLITAIQLTTNRTPDLALAYVQRSVVYGEQKKWELALADCNKAIAIDPDLALSYMGCGAFYYEIGDKQKAIENLQKAAQLFLARGDTATYEQIMNLLKGL